ncbi:arrestin domain-containing protein 3-like [Saccoglossus kowalevskii]|uniref:Arrestin domain-containing protein 3-like n=1 Tax=Saccoglossus kowalevskii TaxID=10224 RepID=A0ABM0GW99_SACKO|nr:PREDICTED: arrestin domain-containing protein 3-like [Saccoglossus kowalevskii]
MDSIRRFCIALDDNRDVFSAGDVVAGRVILELNRGIPCIKGMHIRFLGLVHVTWAEDFNKNAPVAPGTSFNAKEVYFDQIVTFLKNDRERQEDWNLQSGVHRFPFRLQIPDRNLPMSFEGKYGCVRYSLKCTIERSSGKNVYSKRALTVIGKHMDPNRVPNAKAPIVAQTEMSGGCLLCISRPTTMLVRVQRKGYAPGNAIPLKVSINNNSNRRVHEVHATLMQDVKYTAFGVRCGKTMNVCRSKEIIATQSHTEGCQPHSKVTWNANLEIPPVPPSGLEGCDLIDTQYYLKIEAEVSHAKHNLLIEVPVVIGSKQLRHLEDSSTFTDLSPLAKFPSEESLHDEIMPPPSYREVYCGKVSILDEADDEDTFGDLRFAPKYAYYMPD